MGEKNLLSFKNIKKLHANTGKTSKDQNNLHPPAKYEPMNFKHEESCFAPITFMSGEFELNDVYNHYNRINNVNYSDGASIDSVFNDEIGPLFGVSMEYFINKKGEKVCTNVKLTGNLDIVNEDNKSVLEGCIKTFLNTKDLELKSKLMKVICSITKNCLVNKINSINMDNMCNFEQVYIRQEPIAQSAIEFQKLPTHDTQESKEFLFNKIYKSIIDYNKDESNIEKGSIFSNICFLTDVEIKFAGETAYKVELGNNNGLTPEQQEEFKISILEYRNSNSLETKSEYLDKMCSVVNKNLIPSYMRRNYNHMLTERKSSLGDSINDLTEQRELNH